MRISLADDLGDQGRAVLAFNLDDAIDGDTRAASIDLVYGYEGQTQAQARARPHGVGDADWVGAIV